ncbi:EscU/YscU/HrcU family type III secretion system export apparatus switch protein [Anoxynatronum buryatiense]|uniref:Flagellar biosynthesis protein n=1 Tax=Anoxynatronum buryatiense TaxID=489973 RepID=A0AA46AK17_9CLOT|nr:EscU/YscU/HrcU family type III secretion system export apparatus switch protein [Anoxynatronum buryatiense]SMP67310.1 flagellar biosynthesis protein [Anoxynatronum buryatiense]
MKKESKSSPKLKHAVALRYDLQKDFAPRITAKGKGIVAENILRQAEDHQVAVVENERLVKELLQFELGTEIPPELYDIVAQILVFVESVDQEKGLAALKQQKHL